KAKPVRSVSLNRKKLPKVWQLTLRVTEPGRAPWSAKMVHDTPAGTCVKRVPASWIGGPPRFNGVTDEGGITPGGAVTTTGVKTFTSVRKARPTVTHTWTLAGRSIGTGTQVALPADAAGELTLQVRITAEQ